MVTTGDARNILFGVCKELGEELGIEDIFTSWAIPTGKIVHERVVVVSPPVQSAGAYWETCFIPVNFCVPDIDGEANIKRMDEIERHVKARFKDISYGQYDGSAYIFQAESIGREEDTALKCHYIYTSIIFKVLNVK